MANPFVIGIISLTIAVILVVNVLMPTLAATNTSSYSAAELAVYGVVGLGALTGLAYSGFAIFGLA
jgi:hypothetical protein